MLFSACQTSPESTDNFKTIKIELSPDSSKILLTGLEHNIIESLKGDSLNAEEWESLFGVYAKPAGAAESLSEPVQGTYTISGNCIVFSPDSSFVTAHTYDAVFTYPQYNSAGSVLRSGTLPGRLATIENHFDFWR